MILKKHTNKINSIEGYVNVYVNRCDCSVGACSCGCQCTCGCTNNDNNQGLFSHYYQYYGYVSGQASAYSNQSDSRVNSTTA